MNVPRESEVRPEFRAHLEWQIESALRREDRFAAPVAAPWARLRTAAALVAALAIGAAAVAATGKVQERQHRDALVDAVKAEQTLIQLRVELARTALQEARSKFEVGVASRETIQAAEADLRAMEAALARTALNIAEIQATAQAPRDDLQAPLVGQRDFVSERLKLDLAAAQQTLTTAEAALAAAKQRFEVGLSSRAAQLEAQARMLEAAQRMQHLAATLEMRKRALSGEVKIEELAQRLQQMALTLEQQKAEREIALLQTLLQDLRVRVEIGTSGQAGMIELKRTEIDLLQRQLDLERIRQDLKKLTAVRR